MRKKTPETYFIAFYGITNVIMTISVIWWVWNKQKQAQKIANEVYAVPIQPRIKKFLTLYVTFQCIAGAMLSVTSCVFGISIFPSKLWTPQFWWSRLVLTARERFLGYEQVGNNVHPDISVMPLFHKILGVLLGIGLFFRFVMRFYFESLLLAGILSFWMVAYSFARDMNRESLRSKWSSIAWKYRYLRGFSKRFNQAYGQLVFAYVWNSILMYSTRLDSLFTSPDIFFRYRGLYFYISVVMIFLFAADCSRQAQKITTWLSIGNNSIKVTSDNAFALIGNDLNRNNIAVCGLGVFTITYSLAANVAGLVVTYFIICI
ncbi:unnamed protein product [Orchesella dallaii]|uniref:Gustatory receptor n=1 Tax=Orchesella dallaii TaxID=48710 RepID=A0ABP1RGB6_9HEXA